MASVFIRQTKNGPRWYGKYRRADGTWVMRATRQLTREDADRWIGALQAKDAMEAVLGEGPLVKPLMERWMDGDKVPLGQPRRWGGLTGNYGERQRCQVKLHILPRMDQLRLDQINFSYLIKWGEDMKADTSLGAESHRHNKQYLSNFFNWCIRQGFATVNPVKAVPTAAWPAKTSKPRSWLRDDGMVPQIVECLPAPIGLMFLVGNRTGMKIGELIGLRLCDLDFLRVGRIAVCRVSYRGMRELKVPKELRASTEVVARLSEHLARRKSDGADMSDPVFVGRDGGVVNYDNDVRLSWNKLRRRLGIGLSWDSATALSHRMSLESRGDSARRVVAGKHAKVVS